MSRILVVDDEPTIVELIEESLHMEGYATSHAYSGEEALEELSRHPPDLVLLDLMLPGMDGYEVCRQMQKDVRLSQIPVIMLTARSAVSDRVAGYERGADDYITKPFDTDELLVRVRAQLHHLYHEHVNDVSGLPGSEAVEAAISARTAHPDEPWAIIYLDIDHFTPYNEVYTFLQGDELIKMLAKVLRDVVGSVGNPGDFLGHMGGDNFVIVTTPERIARIQQLAQARFAAAAPDFYSPTDRQQGYIVSLDHTGQLRQTPLVTLAFDVVENVPDAIPADEETAEPVH